MSGPTGEKSRAILRSRMPIPLVRLDKVGRREQDIDEFLNLGAQLVDGRERGKLLLGQNVATHAADHVEAVGLAVTGELRPGPWTFADAEELLEAGIEARVVRRQANVEQMRVKALNLEHDSADVLGARRDMDALSALDGPRRRATEWAQPQMPQMRSARNVTAS